MFYKKFMPQWLTPEMGVTCLILGACWLGYCEMKDSDKAVKEDLIKYINMQNGRISELEKKLNNRIDVLTNEHLSESLKIEINEQVKIAIKEELTKGTTKFSQENGVISQEVERFANSSKVENLGYVYGAPNAIFSIYDFSDFSCPYCASFFPEAKKLVDSSNGTINLVFRHFPLEMHGVEAKQKALFAECAGVAAGAKGFWYATEKLFAHVPLDIIAQNLGTTTNNILVCMNTQEAQNGVIQGLAEGNSLKVESTPTVIILDNVSHQKHTFNGAPNTEEIIAVISQMLNELKKQNNVSQN